MMVVMTFKVEMNICFCFRDCKLEGELKWLKIL